jgi:8-oxo-dGTP diphosphatase
VRRLDTGDWELPGGRVDPGESAIEALVREVAEESGIVVDDVLRVAGLYSDPAHVVSSGTTGEVRQPFAVCFHATARPGTPRPDHVEASDACWWDVADLDALPVQPAVRRRLRDALTEPQQVHLG